MQFPVSVIDDKTAPGSTDMRCHQRIQRATHGRALCFWVFAGGLAGTDSATVVDSRGERVMLTGGPCVESKEYLAGVWVWDAPDLDAALELATEASKGVPSNDRGPAVRMSRRPSGRLSAPSDWDATSSRRGWCAEGRPHT